MIAICWWWFRFIVTWIAKLVIVLLFHIVILIFLCLFFWHLSYGYPRCVDATLVRAPHSASLRGNIPLYCLWKDTENCNCKTEMRNREDWLKHATGSDKIRRTRGRELIIHEDEDISNNNKTKEQLNDCVFHLKFCSSPRADLLSLISKLQKIWSFIHLIRTWERKNRRFWFEIAYRMEVEPISYI